MKTIVQRLKALDKDYFKDLPKSLNEDFDHTARRLATYCYDSDFKVNEESWDLFMKIRADFPEVYWSVLENLFKRHHDT